MGEGFHNRGYAAGMTQPRKRNLRWGLLTLLFLLIALVSILVAGSQETYNVVTLLGVVLGFGGAAYCTWKGLKGFSWLPR
jgi:nitrate/nitrite transporter NarK